MLRHRPLAIEGLDHRIVDTVRRRRGPDAVPSLPPGNGWLLVEMGGTDPVDALDRARALAADAGTGAVRILPAGAESAAIWRIREDGAGLAGRTSRNRQAWPGLEDAAVPAEHLGDYLRDLDRLLAEHDLDGAPFGHFGDGCVHLRVDLPLDTRPASLREFMLDAAHAIARYGGSLSGEHGDGRARGELLPTMYSPEMIGIFAAFKGLLDPDDVLNPGIVVRAAPLDADLRRPAAAMMPAAHGFAFAHDDRDFATAVHRCVGVGKCRADTSASGGFMCPSYLATHDEKDSTRGRARVLQEMLNGGLVSDGWRSPEVRESLDLCLSCKACSSDCPAGVDMAAYKSEVLHRVYRRRLRPISHYTLGWMPRWARWATRAATALNAVLRVRPIEQLVLLAGGMDRRRRIPRFAAQTFRRWWSRRGHADAPTPRRPVVLWADTFSDNFSPSILSATVELLESAGYRIVVPPDVCCGLTWITTGQLDTARRKLHDLLDVLAPFAEDGIPILGLEPSCTAVLRSDLQELLPDDPRASRLAASVHTLAELLTAPEPAGPGEEWARPDLSGVEVIAQPHCHQHAVGGWDRDHRLLESLGARVTALAGCCGLAGNFGMEAGHYEMSVAVASNGLLPALEARSAEAVFLADGLSCRTQADQLAGVRGIHLAQLLAQHSVLAAGS
jgi:Fe-S oxidoreductase